MSGGWSRYTRSAAAGRGCSVLFAAPLLGLLALLLTACTTVPVYGDVPECERLIPDSLKANVPGVPIPESEEAEAWMQAFVGQTGQLDLVVEDE